VPVKIARSSGSRLRAGHIQSCGCLRHENLNFIAAGARTAIDETGRRHGRLVAIERAGSDQTGHGDESLALWRCICDCGAIVVRAGAHLRRGSTRSCGCLSRRIAL
jgi:hypothetical protein